MGHPDVPLIFIAGAMDKATHSNTFYRGIWLRNTSWATKVWLKSKVKSLQFSKICEAWLTQGYYTQANLEQNAERTGQGTQ